MSFHIPHDSWASWVNEERGWLYKAPSSYFVFSRFILLCNIPIYFEYYLSYVSPLSLSLTHTYHIYNLFCCTESPSVLNKYPSSPCRKQWVFVLGLRIEGPTNALNTPPREYGPKTETQRSSWFLSTICDGDSENLVASNDWARLLLSHHGHYNHHTS